MIKLPSYRFCSVLILCAGLFLSASAQQLTTIKGVVFKKNSPTIIALVSVANITRKTPEIISDEFGGFHLEAALGDTLLFKKNDYTPQFIVVQNYSSQSVYMQQVIHLDQVNINDISKKKELNNVLDDYKKKGQYYTLDPSVMSVITSPISGLYELFGKSASQARKFRQYTKEELERLEIAKRYNKPLVKQVTNIPDDELEDFMKAFSPTYENIKEWTDYDIIKYIKRSYAYFVDNKANLKLQKLY